MVPRSTVAQGDLKRENAVFDAVDDTLTKRRRGSEAVVYGRTALQRAGDELHGTSPDGTQFTVVSSTIERSHLLSSMAAAEDGTCYVPGSTSDFLAWLAFVQDSAGRAPGGECAESQSASLYFKTIIAALKVADFLCDQEAVTLACQSVCRLVCGNDDDLEWPEDMSTASRSHSWPVKRQDLDMTSSGVEDDGCEVQQSLCLTDPLGFHLVHELGAAWIEHKAYTSPVPASAATVRCPGHMIAPPLLPFFLKRLPPALRTLALRAYHPAANAHHALTLPHVQDDMLPLVVVAACGIEHLASLDVTVDASCCGFTKVSTTHAPDKLQAVRSAMHELAEATGLTALTLRFVKAIRRPCYNRADPSTLCFATFICGVLSPAIGTLAHLCSLELHGFQDPDDRLSAALRQLPALHTLRLMRCRMRSTVVKKADRPAEACKWGVPDALQALGALTELDLSGNRISRYHFKRLVNMIVGLPLRTLALEDCRLNVWESIKAMGEATAAAAGSVGGAGDAAGARRRFADVSRLDLSFNVVKVRGAGVGRDLCEPSRGVLKQLTTLRLGRLRCRSSDRLEQLLQQLQGCCAGLHELSVGRLTSPRGTHARLQRRLPQPRGLRRLHVDLAAPMNILSLLGRSKTHLAELPSLEDLHLGHLSAGQQAERALLRGYLFPLTRLVLTDVQCTAHGAKLLGKWVARATKLQVLHIDGVKRLSTDKKHEPHAETVLVEGLAALTTLRELRLRWSGLWSPGVHVAAAAGVLARRQLQLTALELRLTRDFRGESEVAKARAECKVLVARLRTLTALETLSLQHVVLVPEAVKVLAASVKAMPSLKTLRLWSCLPDTAGIERPILENMASSATMECDKWWAEHHNQSAHSEPMNDDVREQLSSGSDADGTSESEQD